MNLDFSKLFHAASKDLTDGGTKYAPHDGARPAERHTLFYKAYAHAPRLILPRHEAGAAFFRLISQRRSRRAFSAPLQLAELSDILRYSCGETVGTGRAQPSAGARYPIEAYVLVFRDAPGLASGVYHYAPAGHALACLAQRTFTKEEVGHMFIEESVQDAAAAIVLTGVFARTSTKYGQRGYRYVLLEAGHIGQNIYLAARTLGLGSCAVGGTDDAALETLLEIDGENESVVYALAMGAPERRDPQVGITDGRRGNVEYD